MNALLDNPIWALIAGLVITGLVLATLLVIGPVDTRGLGSVVLRFVHVVAAIVWIGLVFFVNFVQLGALQEADEASRRVISRWIVPRVAAGFRHASHLTVVSGALLLVSTGYFLGEWVFSSVVCPQPLHAFVLAAGSVGGFLMWVFVNFAIWPSIKIALGQTAGDAVAQARARGTVKRYARLNLILALPVTFAMIAAAHLS